MALINARNWFFRILILVGLGLASPARSQQQCTQCASGCGMTTDIEEYGDPWCSCPTSAHCSAWQICTTCYSDGLEYCFDDLNCCETEYIQYFMQDCGCAPGGGASIGLSGTPVAARR